MQPERTQDQRLRPRRPAAAESPESNLPAQTAEHSPAARQQPEFSFLHSLQSNLIPDQRPTLAGQIHHLQAGAGFLRPPRSLVEVLRPDWAAKRAGLMYLLRLLQGRPTVPERARWRGKRVGCSSLVPIARVNPLRRQMSMQPVVNLFGWSVGLKHRSRAGRDYQVPGHPHPAETHRSPCQPRMQVARSKADLR